MDEKLFNLLCAGKIVGFSCEPRVIETVISRVFIFNEEDVVLKFYKRDNDWWNKDMMDLSGGHSRIDFIRNDFEFNRFLNPKVYTALKAVVIANETVVLKEPDMNEDELVIVMHKEDISGTFTEVLFENKLTLDEYRGIGKRFARIKLDIPKRFLPESNLTWYEHTVKRLQDLSSWVSSEKDFPEEIAKQGLSLLKRQLEENKVDFQSIPSSDLFVLIDCNSENLIYSNQELRFIDAFPPRDDWRIGTFDVDIFRTGSDIYALAGEDAYNAYLEGIDEIAGQYRNKDLSDFYLLYSALIMAPYFFMLSSKDNKYLNKAARYLAFVKKRISYSL